MKIANSDYKRVCRAISYRLVRNPYLRRILEPEDIVDEAVLRILKREVRNNEIGFGYLMRVSSCVYVDKSLYERRQKRNSANIQPLIDQPISQSTLSDPVENAIYNDTWDRLLSVIMNFDERCRTILDLRREGWTNMEIASRMGCDIRTIQRNIRDIKKLAEINRCS